MSYAHTCRICFANDAKYDNVVILTSGSKWANLFEFCVGISLELGSNPLESCVFCKSCGNKLQEFGEFKNKCIKSEDVWKQMCVEKNKKNAEKLDVTKELKEELNKDDMKIEYLSDSSDSDHDTAGEPILIEPTTTADTQLDTALDLDYNEVGKTDTVIPLFLPTATEKAVSYEQEDSPMDILEREYEPEKWSKPSTICYDSIEPEKRSTCSTTTTPPTNSVVVVLKKLKKRQSFNEPAIIDNLKELPLALPKADEAVNNKPMAIVKLRNARDHDRVKLSLFPFIICGICNYKTKGRKEVRLHWKEHVAKNELNCQLCPYVGRDMADMAGHRYKHYPPVLQKNKECLMCYKDLCSKTDKYLEFHYREEHLNKKGGWCTVCGKKLKYYKSLLDHEEAHVTKHKCDHCGRYFTYHALRMHLKPKDYICDQCGKGFVNISMLNDHMTIKHTAESLNLKCDQCDEVCRTQIQLKKHQYKHKKETHVCDICGATFARKKNLQSHHKTHVDDKPFSCDICGKAFKWLCNMKAHVARHQREPDMRKASPRK